MPLPDPHAGEPVRELNRDTLQLYREALTNVKGWTEEANRLKGILVEELGDAYAGTVNGKKVVAHRPKDQIAWKQLRDAYPDLVPHFMKWETVETLDEERFTQAHPEIVEQYRVRAFTILG